MLIHGEGDKYGEPYRLLPWHREFNWRWWEIDPVEAMGTWWYLEALIGAERGAVKTEALAAHAHTEMAGPDSLRNCRATPIVDIAAAALKQAGEMFRQVQIMGGGAKGQEILRAPLSGVYEILDTKITFADGRPGRIERQAADAGTIEGGKTTLFLADELAQWTGAKAQVFDVINAATTKRMTPGRTIGISMPGVVKGHVPFDDGDPLLWRLHQRGLTERNDSASRFLLDWRVAPKVDFTEPASIERALRMMRGADVTWSVAVRLREILTRKISRSQAQRLYLCQWPDSSAESWLSEAPGVWAECGVKVDDMLGGVPADGADVVVAVDMALKSDHVGVSVLGHRTDGRVAWWPRSWAPTKDGVIDHLEVFGTIAGSIAQRWRVKAITYDPRFFEVPAKLLEDQGFRVIAFPQSPERLVSADDLLYRMILAHEIVHPDDPVLNDHVDNAAWRETDRGRYLAKSKAMGKMDLVRAGSMALWELLAGSKSLAPATSRAPADTGPSSDFFRPSNRLAI